MKCKENFSRNFSSHLNIPGESSERVSGSGEVCRKFGHSSGRLQRLQRPAAVVRVEEDVTGADASEKNGAKFETNSSFRIIFVSLVYVVISTGELWVPFQVIVILNSCCNSI